MQNYNMESFNMKKTNIENKENAVMSEKESEIKKHNEEMLDVVDENGNPTGEIVSRTEAHRLGIRHRTSHVWIAKTIADDEGKKEVMLLIQVRSKDKDSHPGCYDISSAGHITAGDSFEGSAVREMKEELGVDIEEKDLIYLGQRHREYKKDFHGYVFHDNQVSNVYVVEKDVNINELSLQESEIESALWMSLDEAIDMVENNTIPHCINILELEWLKKYFAK